MSEDSKTLYLSQLGGKSLQILDASDPHSPRSCLSIFCPNMLVRLRRHGTKMLSWSPARSNCCHDPEKAIATSEQLGAAHAEALRLYRQDDPKSPFRGLDKAINILKAAGIDHVLDKKPSGISDKVLAGFSMTMDFS